MKINRIGFGYTKSLGNYENCKVWLEADLEDWEDPSESLNYLRSQVAQELDLPDKWHDLKGKFNRQLQALEVTNAALTKSQEHLKKAQEEWEKYEAFLVAHGVDPESLNIKIPSSNLPDNQEFDCESYLADEIAQLTKVVGIKSTPEEISRLARIVAESFQEAYAEGVREVEKHAHNLDAANDLLPLNEHARGNEDDEDDYFDPYYGDEYDRLPDHSEEPESENSYF